MARARDRKTSVDDLGARDGIVVDEEDVVPRLEDPLRRVKRDVAGARPAKTRLIRRNRIEHDELRLLDPAREREGEPFKILQERSERFPIRLAEMITRRRPFPITSVGRVIEPVKVKEVRAKEEILVRGKQKSLGSRAPAETVISLEPNSGTVVKVRDRRRNLVLNEVGVTAGSVVSRRGVPTDRAEIIAKFARVPPATSRIARVYSSAPRVPVENRDEITLFGEPDADVHEIEPIFFGKIAAVGVKHRG